MSISARSKHIQVNAIPFDPEFTAGAHNAVHVCLRIQPDEQVCVITDEATMEIAAAIVAELEKLGAPYHAWVLEELADRPLRTCPRKSKTILRPVRSPFLPCRRKRMNCARASR